MSENRGIGNKGQIPWKNSEDFKWFKEFTLNKTILVGSKTYLSLPILPNRKMLVLSNSLVDSFYNAVKDTAMATVSSGEVTLLAKSREIIVAGGAQVYKLFLPQITEFYVTHIEGNYETDIFMPPFEHLFNKTEVIREFKSGKVIKYSRLTVTSLKESVERSETC